MGVFPAIYSTLSPEALIEEVLDRYEIGKVNRCLFWNRGLSDIYLIEAHTQSYILKISHHHWRSQSEIQFELEFLDFLYHQDIPVANPLKTKTGDLFVTVHAVEGDRYAALFPCAPGEVPQGDLSLEQSKIMGQTLGSIHQAALNFDSTTQRHSLDAEHLLDDSLTIICPYLGRHSSDLDYLHTTIEKIKLQLTCLEQASPLWSVCWGDPHSGNVHFTADNQITLFDFDQCGYGWRIFDIAKFLQVSLSAGISRPVRDSFLVGYQNIQKLESVEISSLQALTQMAHIWAWAISTRATAIHNWSRLDSYYMKKRLHQLKRLSSPEWQLF